eukprot:CAMPEP_0173231336 /NCGR_PEP_ID=MMETSP1142-20121109/8328_1 /TAXON_ID=483371 /ORGANISM="non described non described, Strain CCMP2298" /LENGTH=98 /DNA_ID=CAMNT_0014160683 /DNA_START=280 /DNA_END=576 /DNA_ORIENTATION=+
MAAKAAMAILPPCPSKMLGFCSGSWGPCCLLRLSSSFSSMRDCWGNMGLPSELMRLVCPICPLSTEEPCWLGRRRRTDRGELVDREASGERSAPNART